MSHYADPVGEKMVPTGIQLCNAGGTIGHTYIKTTTGVGYGLYAQCHLERPSCWSSVKTLLITTSVLVDYDHEAYPDVGCAEICVDDDCVDPDCYAKNIESTIRFTLLYPPGYNVIVSSCHTWAVNTVYGIGISNSIYSNCKKKGGSCSGKVISIGPPEGNTDAIQ